MNLALQDELWTRCHVAPIPVPEPLPADNRVRDRDDLILFRETGALVIARCWFYLLEFLAREYGFRPSPASLTDTPEIYCQHMLGDVTEEDAVSLARGLREAADEVPDEPTEGLPEYLVVDPYSIGEPLLPYPPGASDWLAGRHDLIERVAAFCEHGAFGVHDPGWLKWWPRFALAQA